MLPLFRKIYLEILYFLSSIKSISEINIKDTLHFTELKEQIINFLFFE